MLKQANFGQLVKILRKKTSDERGEPWTRESLSKHLHLSINQLGRLERGDRKYYDSQTLELLANAFKLAPVERKVFLTAAAGIIDEDYCCHLAPEEQLRELLEVTCSVSTPAFILDAYQDIIAINKICLDLFMITEELIDAVKDQPFSFNLLRYMYSPALGFNSLLGPLWQNVAKIQIQQFRRTSFRFQHHDYYKLLIDELLKEPKFDIDWYASHRDPNEKYLPYESFGYLHPEYGPLNYVGTEVNTETVYGELQLILYTPANLATATVFYQLAVSEAHKVIRMADWPIKTSALF